MTGALTRRPTRDLTQAATQGIGGLKHPMISRAGNRFTLVDTAGSQKPWDLLYIDVVIADIGPNDSRMYFAGQFDPANAGNGEPPTCFSDNGIGPSSQARVPQSALCSSCPQAVWGSKITQQGNAIPACQSGKKLAVLVLNDPSGLAYEFRVPPGSYSHKPTTDPQQGGWVWYCNALKGYNLQPCDVITRISFAPNTMGVLQFKPVGMVAGTPQEQQLNSLWDHPDVHGEIVGDQDRPIDPEQWKARQLAASAAAPQPQQFQPPQQQPVQQVTHQPQAAPPFAPPQTNIAPNAAAPGATGFVPPQQQPVPAGPAPTASPTEPEKPKRTRRSKEQMAADAAAAAGAVPQQPVQGQAPPFAVPPQQPVQPAAPAFVAPPAAPTFVPPQQVTHQEVIPPGQPSGAPPLPFTPPAASPDIPPFLDRTPQPAAAPQPTPDFGVQAPAGVDAAMALNLDTAFGLPTK